MASFTGAIGVELDGQPGFPTMADVIAITGFNVTGRIGTYARLSIVAGPSPKTTGQHDDEHAGWATPSPSRQGLH